MSPACGEKEAAVGQRRTTCGGDGKGHWQGWKSPREPKSLSPWVQQWSPPPRPVRSHVVLGHWWGLLASLHSPSKAGNCHTGILHSASLPHIPQPQKEPRATREGQVLPSQGLGLRAWPCCPRKPRQGLLSLDAACTGPLPTAIMASSALLERGPGGALSVTTLRGAQ